MQAVEERDDNPGSAKDNERLLIERDIDVGGFHPTSLAGPDRVLVENGSVVLWRRGIWSRDRCTQPRLPLGSTPAGRLAPFGPMPGSLPWPPAVGCSFTLS